MPKEKNDDLVSDPYLVDLVRKGGRLVSPQEAAKLTRETFQGTIIWRPNGINVCLLREIQ